MRELYLQAPPSPTAWEALQGHSESGTLLCVPTTKDSGLVSLRTPWFGKTRFPSAAFPRPRSWQVPQNEPKPRSASFSSKLGQPLTRPSGDAASVTEFPETVRDVLWSPCFAAFVEKEWCFCSGIGTLGPPCHLSPTKPLETDVLGSVGHRSWFPQCRHMRSLHCTTSCC